MIKLKPAINKSALLRELEKLAEYIYEDAWKGEMRKEDFMDGVYATLNAVREEKEEKENSCQNV